MAPNKKKKKPAANPARGFATVSVPSTKPKEEPSESTETKGLSGGQTQQQQQRQISPKESNGASNQGTTTVQTDDMTPEQLEQHLEASEIRLAVEKQGLKVKKDVARQVKALETDRRLLRSQATPLESFNSFSEELLGKVMDLIRLEPSYSTVLFPLPTAASGLTSELDLSLKVWTLYQTLTELKFPNPEAVIKHVLDHTTVVSTVSSSRDVIWGLDEALYWYALNVEDAELPPYDRTQAITSQYSDDDEDPTALSGSGGGKPSQRSSNIASSKSSSAVATPAVVTDESSNESADDADPPSIPQYLDLQSILFALQNTPPTTESSESTDRKARKLTSKIVRIERDPLFDLKEAQFQWNSRKRQLGIEAAQEKARNKRAQAQAPSPSPQPSNDDGASIGANEENQSADPGLFSGLFELGDSLPTSEAESGPEVTIKDFGKWSGASPRRILEDACKQRDSACRITFKLVSTSFHAHRHQVDVTWSKDTPQPFPEDMLLPEIKCQQNRRTTSVTVQTIGTPTSVQSEAYAATIMLFIIFSSFSQGERPNVRLPTTWRHLWNDLQDQKAAYDTEVDVKKLSELRSLVRQHLPGIEAREKVVDKSVTRDNSSSDNAKTNTTISSSADPEAMQALWTQKSSTPAYQQMLKSREQLPVYKQKSDLMQVFSSNQLMILCGETGSGKSTQTPALVLESELSAGRDCKILCTQPRRISAMSLAARVSEELGEQKGDLGTTRSLVGYAIRLESKVSASTRLTYSTTGVAMRLLERQDDLAGINVLLIDEVHERNIDSDFLLIVLRRLLPRRPDLKVVLMSATIDADRFSSYLNGCPIVMVPGRTFPVQTLFLEDAIEATNSLKFQQTMGAADYEDNDADGDYSDAHSLLQNLQGYSEKTISILRRLNEYRIDFGFITKILMAISSQPEFVPYSKAILIFMPGIGEMRRLHQAITSLPYFQRGWIFHILHSSVSTEDQQAAFRVPPQGTRKIVIATNIAETGITIPDITAVIDTGKEKIMRFDEKRQVSRLTESFISKASSKQRQGRAARVQEGLCVKLYTRDRYERLMPEHSTPEILRLSLSETILRVKLCSLGPIEASLSEALDPPTPKNVRRAIEALKEENVLTTTEELTPIGRRLARLPLDIPLGKLVLNGLSFQCLDVMVTVAALLSSKSPFVTSVHTTSAVDMVRKSFARGDSDLLLLFSAYQAWKQAEGNGSGATFCQKTFLSRQTLSLIEDQKVQLIVHLVDAGLLILTDQERSSLQASRYKGFRASKKTFFNMPLQYNQNGERDDIISAAIALSFYPKLLRREGKGWRNISSNQTVILSPQSINREAMSSLRWLSFYQTMQTKAMGLSVSETSVVDELSVALLVGEGDCKFFSGTMTLDSNRARFSVRSWKVLLALKELRSKVRAILLERSKALGYQTSELENRWVDFFYDLYR